MLFLELTFLLLHEWWDARLRPRLRRGAGWVSLDWGPLHLSVVWGAPEEVARC